MGLKLFVFAFVFVFVFSSMFLYVYLYSQEKWAPQCTGTGAGKKGLGGLTGGRSTESCITSIAPPPFYTSILQSPLFYTLLEPKIYYKATIHQLLPPIYTLQCSVMQVSSEEGMQADIYSKLHNITCCTCNCMYHKSYQGELHLQLDNINCCHRSQSPDPLLHIYCAHYAVDHRRLLRSFLPHSNSICGQ